MRISNWLLFLTCSLLPLYVVRFEIFGIPTTLLEVLILALFVVWFFEKGLITRRWSGLFKLNNFFYPTLFFLAVAVIEAFLSVDQTGGLGILKAYFIEPILLFVVVAEKIKSGSGKVAFFGLVTAAAWLSVLAIFQRLTWLGVPEYSANEISQGRVVAVYNSANSLALFLGPVFALILGWFFTWVKAVENKLITGSILLFLLLVFAAVILTKSQAGIIGVLIVSAFILLCQILPIKKIIVVFTLGVGATLFATILLPILAFFGINFAAILGDVTLQNRFYLWGGSMNLVLARPLIGAGLDGFRELYGANYRPLEYDELLQYPHNLILNFWTETGFLGVIAFLWVLFAFAKNFLPNQSLRIGLMGVILYILIHGIVDVPYFKNDLSAQFFILLALSNLRTVKDS